MCSQVERTSLFYIYAFNTSPLILHLTVVFLNLFSRIYLMSKMKKSLILRNNNLNNINKQWCNKDGTLQQLPWMQTIRGVFSVQHLKTNYQFALYCHHVLSFTNNVSDKNLTKLPLPSPLSMPLLTKNHFHKQVGKCNCYQLVSTIISQWREQDRHLCINLPRISPGKAI